MPVDLRHVFGEGVVVNAYRRVMRDGAYVADVASGSLASGTVTSGKLTLTNVPSDLGRGIVLVGGGKTISFSAHP